MLVILRYGKLLFKAAVIITIIKCFRRSWTCSSCLLKVRFQTLYILQDNLLQYCMIEQKQHDIPDTQVAIITWNSWIAQCFRYLAVETKVVSLIPRCASLAGAGLDFPIGSLPTVQV